MNFNGRDIKRDSSGKNITSPKYLVNKNNPPNGTTVGVGNPMLRDVATASPPSKYLTEGCSTIKVVANYQEEEGQKYVVKPLLNNSYNYNHICCTNGKYTAERPSISKSLSDLDGTLLKRGCDSFVEESYGNPMQNTITSFVVPKNHNSMKNTKHDKPRRAFHKMNLDSYDDKTMCRRDSQHYSDDLKSDASYSEPHHTVFPKSETLSEMEGISKCSSKSMSMSPITGCERLL